MKVCNVNLLKKIILLSVDYWEAESLGFDVKKQRDVAGTYYSTILKMINDTVMSILGPDFRYGIKAYNDTSNGCFYYEILPYEQRMNDLRLEDMVLKHYTFDIDSNTLFHW